MKPLLPQLSLFASHFGSGLRGAGNDLIGRTLPPMGSPGLAFVPLARRPGSNLAPTIARPPLRDACFAARPARSGAGPSALRLAGESAEAGTLRASLVAQYGLAHVESRLEHDVFVDDRALERQLAHEEKPGITAEEYLRIAPFGQRGDTDTEAVPGVGAWCEVPLPSTPAEGSVERDVAGSLTRVRLKGSRGVPDGWQVDDRIDIDPTGIRKLRTRLIGPNGESGMVMRSFDGTTLHLDKAYKSTLPSRLDGVPGFDRPLSTIHYLTARACRVLGITAQNLQYIYANRLHHRPTLAHLDWLRRKYPERSLSDLLSHTTRTRSYIRETAGLVGRAVEPEPVIDLEDSVAWLAAHPERPLRDWQYMADQPERLVYKHLTGRKLPKVLDPSQDWRAAAAAAVSAHREERCRGLSGAETIRVDREIDTQLAKRIGALHQEDQLLRQRYDIPNGTTPKHINFDVTFRLASKRVAGD